MSANGINGHNIATVHLAAACRAVVDNDNADLNNATATFIRAQLARFGIVGEVKGKGRRWTLELENDDAHDEFERCVGVLGGYRTGWGGWELAPRYTAPSEHD